MPIPTTQLESWSNAPTAVSAEQAYGLVRATLVRPQNLLAPRAFEVYLQGSYRNRTNVRSDSDVDVVAELTETTMHDFTEFPREQWAPLRAQIIPHSYTLDDFRRHVGAVLRERFGAAVEQGDRCWQVAGVPGRQPVDVVVAQTLKVYKPRWALGPYYDPLNFDQGIYFQDRQGGGIKNYPLQHYDNGVAKNTEERTKGQFKATVRMFKNARTCAVERNLLREACASSYFVDCLLWNVPDRLFTDDRRATFVAIVNHLLIANKNDYMCRNGIVPLFGAGSQQWTEVAAVEFIQALVRLWEGW